MHGEVDADDDNSGRDDVGGDLVGRIDGVGGVEGGPVDSCAPEGDDIGGRTGDGDSGRLRTRDEEGCRGLGGGVAGSGAMSDGCPPAGCDRDVVASDGGGGQPLVLSAVKAVTA